MKGLEGYRGKRICVATSGGADSTALLHFLKTREAECGYSLSAVHFEHGIRGAASEADMRFVTAFCQKLGVPLFVFREDCVLRAAREKCSVETAAREFRREGYLSLIREKKADYIATAHHSGDQAETVLFRIARGAALTGAVGMREEEGFYLRPFLHRSKEDILRYIRENGLTYCEDQTNYQTEYTRNKLRLDVFPVLEEAVPNAKESFARFASLAAEDEAYLQRESAKLLQKSQGEREIWTVAFCNEAALFRRATLTAMRALGCEKDYTAAHLESVFALQSLSRGARITLPKGVEAEKTERGIALYRVSEKEVLPAPKSGGESFENMQFDGGRYAVNVSLTPVESDGDWKTLRVDLDAVPQNAVFRFRREGDEMRVFGGGTKSLKKLFNERKIPVSERAYLPLVASAESGEVYAVVGVEISDGVKVTEKTGRAAYIALRKK